MGRDLVRVERVDPCRTVNPSVMSYTVTGETIEDTPRTVQFQTANDWKAAVCSQAGKLKQLVWIGWRDTSFGHDIVTVEIDTTKWQHESEAS